MQKFIKMSLFGSIDCHSKLTSKLYMYDYDVQRRHSHKERFSQFSYQRYICEAQGLIYEVPVTFIGTRTLFSR